MSWGRRKKHRAYWKENKDGSVKAVLFEEDVVEEIESRLCFHKIPVYRLRERIPGKGRYSTPGLPDLTGWVPRNSSEERYQPIPLYIETKRPGGAHRVAQERFIKKAREAGCCAFFAESWGDVVEGLRSAGVKLAP